MEAFNCIAFSAQMDEQVSGADTELGAHSGHNARPQFTQTPMASVE